MNKSCAQCGRAASMQCDTCKIAYYCCLKHQEKHWKKHKDNCNITLVAFEQRSYFIASKPIAINDIIYEGDDILLVYSVTFTEMGNTGVSFHDLELNDAWNKIKELKKNKAKYDRFLTLRYKIRDIDKSFAKDMKSKINCDLTEDELAEIHSRIDFNSFYSTGQHDKKNHGTLFALFSFFKHSCMHNAMFELDMSNRKWRIKVKAVKPILEGELVTTSRIPLLANKFRRQLDLIEYGFICKCPRCEDVTEFETNVGAVNCLKCNGYMYFDLSTITYKCNDRACSIKTSANELEAVFKELQDEIKEALDTAANATEKYNALFQWLNVMEDLVHPNHALLFKSRFQLMQIMASKDFRVQWIDKPELAAQYRDVCVNLLNLLTKLDPHRDDQTLQIELNNMKRIFSGVIDEEDDIECCSVI